MVTPHQDPDHIHFSVLCSMMKCSLVKLYVRGRRVEKGERKEGKGRGRRGREEEGGEGERREDKGRESA